MKLLMQCLVFACCLLAFQDTLYGQWYQERFPSTETLYKVRFVSTQTGWILGASGLYKTENGGQTWTRRDSANGFGDLLLPLSEHIVFYASATNRKPQTSSGLRRTLDGGLTWQKVETSQFAYLDIDFASANVGFLVAADSAYKNPVLMKTTDRGTTWQIHARSFPFTKTEISDISFIDEQRGWAVSYDAFIFHTSDGGVTWGLQDSIRASNDVGFPLRRIHFTSADSGWAVGGIGGFSQIAQTIDGGKHWSITTQMGCSLRDMVFLNSQEGWLAGTSSLPAILRTSDGGRSWTQETLQPAQSRAPGIWSIAVRYDNHHHGWAVGDSGRYYVIGSVVGVKENHDANEVQPRLFQLHPVHPNPVRQATQIVYELPRAAQTRLAVYDVLGREVALLFVGAKPAGIFSSSWNGRDHSGALVPNGLYFCRLEVEAHVMTRKVVVLR